MRFSSSKLKPGLITKIRKECNTLEQALTSDWITEEKKAEYQERLIELYRELSR
jgi:hypothetical protein